MGLYGDAMMERNIPLYSSDGAGGRIGFWVQKFVLVCHLVATAMRQV